MASQEIALVFSGKAEIPGLRASWANSTSRGNTYISSQIHKGTAHCAVTAPR